MLIFIVNPVAGKGRSLKNFALIEAYLKQNNIAFKYLETKYHKHATELVKSTPQDAVVIGVGGDGTIREVADGVYGSSRTIGIIPSGTGNDFAKSLGISEDPIEAIKQIIPLKKHTIDLGYLSDSIFLNVAGMGFDADVLRHSSKMRRFFRGFWVYYMSIFLALLTYKFKKVKIVTPERVIERDVLMLAMGNGRFFGGGMIVCPRAVPDDGLMDVLVIKKIPRLRILAILPKFIKGTHLALTDCVEYFQCKELILDSPDADYLNIDGELVDFTAGKCGLHHNTLSVLVP